MVSLGKTNTPEFGSPCYTEPDVAPPAVTPWDRDADGRRLVGRCRGRGRRGPGAGRPGLGRRRLDPDPGVVLRPGRAEAHARPDQRLPDVRRDHRARHGRHARPDGPRRGRPARRAGRRGVRRPVLGSAAVGAVPGRLRPRAGAAADRALHRAGDRRRRRSTPSAWPRGSRRRRLLASLGHEVEDIAVPMPREAVPTFETCWAVLTALSPVPPEQEDAAAAAHPVAGRRAAGPSAGRSSGWRWARCAGSPPTASPPWRRTTRC